MFNHSFSQRIRACSIPPIFDWHHFTKTKNDLLVLETWNRERKLSDDDDVTNLGNQHKFEVRRKTTYLDK